MIQMQNESLKNRKSHKHIIEKIRRKVIELERQNWKREFNWIKAQAGHQRNELEDELAKEAVTNSDINLLTPNVNYSGRTAPLTSKVAFYIFIQQVQVLNILNTVYTVRFFSSKCSLFHNSNVFGSVLLTFYIQGVLKLKK